MNDVPPPSLAPSSLVDLLLWRRERMPDENAYTFLSDGERQAETMTYGRLFERAGALAGRLREAGATEPALLLVPPGNDYVVSVFACLLAGIPAVPAYPPRGQGMARIRGIVEQARIRLAVCPRSVATTLARDPVLAGLRCVETDSPGGCEVGRLPARSPAPDHAAIIQFTSGSTRQPSGVVVSHANLVSNLALVTERFGITPSTRAVHWLPMYHDMGLIGGVLEPLYAGFEVVFMSPAAFMERPARWLEAISRLGAEVSGGPDFAYDLCVQRIDPEARERLDLSSWRVAFNGAEPVRAETLARFGAAFRSSGFRESAFFPCYGLAECTVFVAGGGHDGAVTLLVEREALGRGRVVPAAGPGTGSKAIVGCGRAGDGHRVRIVDPETGVCCARDTVGEIWIAGPSVAEGYWNDPEATERVFRARLRDARDGAYLRSGDLGFIHEDVLYVTGRLKDLIVVRGENIYPQDLEFTAAGAHPALSPGRVAAFAVEAEGTEGVVVVAEIGRRFMRASRREIETAVRKAVAEEHGLALSRVALIRFGTLPRTSSGKVQRQRCRGALLEGRLALLGADEAEVPALRTGTGPDLDRLAAIWTSVLGVDRVGPEDDFFRLGGTSSQAAMVTAAASEAFPAPLPAHLLFQHPRLADFAAAVDGALREGSPPGLPLPRPGKVRELMEASRSRSLSDDEVDSLLNLLLMESS